MAVFGLWFLLIEIQQFLKQPIYYFKNILNNITDLLPIICLFINIIVGYRYPDELSTNFWRLQAITAILIWAKFISFLRSNDKTAYLIRTLIESGKDMAVFMFILTIAILGFADSFLSVSNSMKANKSLTPEQQAGWLDNYYGALRYSYWLTLGEF